MVPAPEAVAGTEAHAAEGAVEADERDPVGAALEHRSPRLGEPQAAMVLDERAELRQAVEGDRVAHEGRLLARHRRQERLLAGARARRHGREHRALRAAQAVAGAGQLLEQPPQRGGEERQALLGRGGGAGERARVGAAEDVPHGPGGADVLAGDRGAGGPQARELVRLELAEPGEAGAPGEGADADQLDRGRAVGQAGQDLDELELVVEVVLEPQHDGLARPEGLIQPLVASAQLLLDLLRAGGPEAGQVLRAHGPQLGRRERGHRPLVEHVAPGDDVAADSRPPHDVDGRVAVGEVEHAIPHGHGSPISVGSGSSETPKRSRTPPAISRASAISSAALPAPRFVSASVCLAEIAIPPGSPWPRWKPARSISHAADVFTRPSGSGKRGGRSTRSSSAAKAASDTIGLVKNEPAETESGSSVSSTIPLPRRSPSTASRTSPSGAPSPG